MRDEQDGDHATWRAIFIIAVAIYSLLTFSEGRADVVTEFGMGYKFDSTSFVMKPVCRQAVVVNPEWPTNPRGNNPYGCGGDNPAFIGWPIAWEKSFTHDVWSVRVGWFHYSNWFDGGNYFHGGDQWETHMDLAAATATFNWSAWLRKRRAR